MNIEKNTSGSKSRLIGLLLMVSVLAITSSVCTQFVAGKLAYHPALGAPLFGQIYNPVDWWGWMPKFYGYAANAFGQALIMFSIGFFLSVGVFRLTVGITSRSSRKHEGIHGTAHFASEEEVKATGLLGNGAGVYCGGFHDPNTGRTHYLRHDGNEHVCVIAPTGSGKGVGLVVPTLLSWPGSVFVLDIKGENYAITAGWRKLCANNVVLCFDPANPIGSCGWNALEEIRVRTDYQISDAQNIALMVIDDDGKGIQGNHFRSAAYELLVGLFLHALYKSGEVGRVPGLPDCAEMLAGVGDFAALPPEFDDLDDEESERAIRVALFDEMRSVNLNDQNPVVQSAQRKIRATGQRFRSTPERELGSIVSTAHTALALYTDTNVSKNTSRSDFKISDLMDYDRPMSLYFITTPNDLVRMRPLARLLLTRIVASLAGRMEFEAGRSKTMHKHRLLMMLDEFPALGRLDIFESALAYIRGYGIKAYIITQDIQQLYKAYTNYESIISNCHVRIAYAPNKQETAEWLSKMTGQTTVIKEQISTSGKRFGAILGNVSRSYQEVQRPLMTPHETTQLAMMHTSHDAERPGEMLVFVAGSPVIFGRQTPYFLDPTFSKRSLIPPPAKSDVVRHKESKTGQEFSLK